jgi:hypothetical protein
MDSDAYLIEFSSYLLYGKDIWMVPIVTQVVSHVDSFLDLLCFRCWFAAEGGISMGFSFEPMPT